jgi:hypothetical protein
MPTTITGVSPSVMPVHDPGIQDFVSTLTSQLDSSIFASLRTGMTPFCHASARRWSPGLCRPWLLTTGFQYLRFATYWNDHPLPSCQCNNAGVQDCVCVSLRTAMALLPFASHQPQRRQRVGASLLAVGAKPHQRRPASGSQAQEGIDLLGDDGQFMAAVSHVRQEREILGLDGASVK